MVKYFRSYEVWPRFPSVSMSGTICALHCKHCEHQYLHDMKDLTSPEQLYTQCLEFYEQGAFGVLLSGGCDNKGRMLNLPRLLPTIRTIKDETGLIIKLHTGLVDKSLAEQIVESGVDIASIEIVGDNSSIHEIFGMHATIYEYEQSLQYLQDAGMPFIVPHVCIGLHYGKIKGEYHALELIKQNCQPSTIVFIVFRPTKHTPLESLPAPSPNEIVKVIQKAHNHFPSTDLSLGCIRPRTKGREIIEQRAIDAGVTRMELPLRQTISYVQHLGFTVRTIDACCALPKELENGAIRKPYLHAHGHS